MNITEVEPNLPVGQCDKQQTDGEPTGKSVEAEKPHDIKLSKHSAPQVEIKQKNIEQCKIGTLIRPVRSF